MNNKNRILYCNKCGKEHTLNNTTKEGIENQGKINSKRTRFNYGSRYWDEIWKYNICEDCEKEFTDSFKIPPTIKLIDEIGSHV